MDAGCKDIHLALYGVSLGPAGLISFQLQPCKIWISSCKATSHSRPLQSQRTVKVNMHHHTNVQSLFPCSVALLTFPEKTLGAHCRELTFRRTTAAQHLPGLSLQQLHTETLELALYRPSLDQALEIICCFITYAGASSRPHQERGCTWAGWLIDLASRDCHRQPH